MKRALLMFGLAAVAVAANAQTRASFQVPSSLTGVNITSSSKVDYNVALAGGASMFYKGKTYQVKEIFGFWLLDNNNDMNADGNSFSGWSYNENYQGQGGIAGYRSNSGDGIDQGQNQSYKFKKVDGTVEHYGIKISLKDCGDKLYLELPCEPVPEPATMAVLGLGAAALIRRRKRA